MIYVDVFLEISLGLTKFSRTASSGVFVTVCFLTIILLPKQTIFTKNELTNQRKYKMDRKLTLHFIFYITLC